MVVAVTGRARRERSNEGGRATAKGERRPCAKRRAKGERHPRAKRRPKGGGANGGVGGWAKGSR